MTLDAPRYAVYFVPRSGTRLAAFAECIFAPGWSPTANPAHAPQGWNVAPQRYGFHATLKAPFHLSEGHTEADLGATALTVAAAIPRFQVSRLAITRLDDFIALTPPRSVSELGQLARACVQGFEHLRAALTAGDREA
jgi:hypothetical protein